MREFRYTGRFKEFRHPLAPCFHAPDFYKSQGIRPPLPRELRLTFDEASRRISRSEGVKLPTTRSDEQYFIAPKPLPQELAEVLVEYDQITAKADRGDPEWDFVMRAADYRVIREFFANLKPGGAPTVIKNPPRPA